MMVWAFNAVEQQETRDLLVNSLKKGKSRFGWSQKDGHNLLGHWSEWHSRQFFLLDIKQGDWIVHINTPQWGKCIAAKVISGYEYDEGIRCAWGTDFRHNIKVDTTTIVEFDRNDPNVLATVNLKPRQRYHRVYETKDFEQSIDNLQENKISLEKNENRQEFQLREKIREEQYLKKITELIHKFHKGKKLEHFIAKVFKKLPDVVQVKENGSGWGTDHGADLLVKTKSKFWNIELEQIIVVQVKSYEGKHFDVNAVEQIKNAIENYNADAGVLVTTADSTEELEKEIAKVSQSSSEGKSIEVGLIAGEDVARLVLTHAPELLFGQEK